MLRYVDATPKGDAWDLQAQVDGEWVTINAGLPSENVRGRFPASATHWRLVDAWTDGRAIPTEPVPFSDLKSLGPIRRKFSDSDREWLAANGIDERLAATFPRGHSLADIKDALSE